MPLGELLKTYYRLTKPGIIYGNLIVTAGGFLLASRGHIDLLLFFAVMGGTALVIASGCVFNNYIDRDIDKKMARTQKRALATGAVSGRSAILYASTLAVIGFVILVMGTNILALVMGANGLFLLMKVRLSHRPASM